MKIHYHIINTVFMRDSIINFVKTHPLVANFLWGAMRAFMRLVCLFIPVNKKAIIFSSFGGRRFDDSPRALYDKICRMNEFSDWKLIWAFVKPENYELPRGEKVTIDTITFFKALLSSHVWIGNSEVDRGIRLYSRKFIRIETWHGTPIKKICGEENETSVETINPNRRIDKSTIRCAQSEYDRDIFARIFSAQKETILLSDLPRNDSLLYYTDESIDKIKANIGINPQKKVILYTPTYREYLISENRKDEIVPPIDLEKWEKTLGDKYVLLVRAHYVVSESLNLPENEFVIDVSNYDCLNDLYAISDIMISDYSSTFFDYSILHRPMFCFAYDLEEYSRRRGLYIDLEKELPCVVDKDEDLLLSHIMNVNYTAASEESKKFQMKYAPYAGHSCDIVINKLIERLNS